MVEQDQSQHVRLHAIVDGHVQGVGFRAFVVEQATRRKLVGWVRNLYNGKVEVMAEGPRPTLEQFLAELHIGPRSAYVTEVKETWGAATGEFHRFYVLSSY